MKMFYLLTKIALAVIFLLLAESSRSQKKDRKNSVGISFPVIWNNSEATYYQLGSPKYPSGKATSYGLNIDYSHCLYNGIYGKLGVGYFKQNFSIIRPFRYDSPIFLLYSTDSYHYDNVQLYGAIGYKLNISKWIFLNGNVTYNQYYSFRQKYIINQKDNVSQINKKSFSLGEMVNFDFEISRNISRKISVGMDFSIPIHTHWNKDEIFINNYYSSDEQQIARNKFSAGISVSCNYNF